MKSTHACGALLALSALCLSAAAQGTQSYSSNSLLPLPEMNLNYPTARYPSMHTAAHPTNAAAAWYNPSVPEPEAIAPGNEYFSKPAQVPYGKGCKSCGHHRCKGGCTKGSKSCGHHACKGGCGKGTKSCGKQGCKGGCGKSHGKHHLGLGVFHSLWPIEHRTATYGARTGCGWFGGVGGLVMTRDNDDHYHFSYGDAAEHVQHLDIRNVDMDWTGGFETRFGKFFNCGQNAWEVVYWGVFPGLEENVLLDDGVDGILNAILNFDQLSIDVGGVPTNLGGWVNNAEVHRIQRDFSFNNIELNIWNYSGCSAVGCRSTLQYNWGFGLRYFRVDDEMNFAAKEAGSSNDFDNSTNQVNYDIDVDNNLIGAQLIGNGEYFLNNCWSFVLGTKVGVYGNVINHRSRIYNVDGTAYVNNGPNQNLFYDVSSTKDDVVMMAEINLGVNYRHSDCWSFYGGYRALGISSLATSVGQIPGDLRGIQDVAIIDSNDDMILHGFYFGGVFNW